MTVSIIYAHPSDDSFNYAIYERVTKTLQENRHTLYIHDLYEEGFDPILPGIEIPKNGKIDNDIRQYCRELAESDGIVIIHPNWWGMPPAIMKGWIDRVIRPGVAYGFKENDQGEGVPVGMLKGKKAIVFNTGNTPLDREMNLFGDPLKNLWKTCIFDLCGITDFTRRLYGVIVTSTLEQRKKWLTEVETIIKDKFPRANLS